MSAPYGTFGYGQQEPSDSASDFSVMCFTIEQMMLRMRTNIPVQVLAVNAPGGLAPAGTVDVLPLVSQLDGNGNAFPHGPVLGLPYFRLQGGQFAVILDPAVGDVGYVAVADRDISSVVASSGKASAPGSRRVYDLADGIYVGGILNQVPVAYVMFTQQGGLTIVAAPGQPINVTGTGGITLTGAQATMTIS